MKIYLVSLVIGLLWVYREWSWSSWDHQRQIEINDLRDQIVSLKLQNKVEIESFQILFESLHGDDKSILQQCNTTSILSNLYSKTIIGDSTGKNQILSSSDSFSVLSLRMLLTVAIFLICLWYELDGIYGVADAGNINNDETFNKELDSQIRSFLTRHHPLLTCAYFIFWYLISWIGWIGLLDYSFIIYHLMTSFFGLIAATLIVFGGLNIRQIWKYLPKSIDDFKKRLSDFEWWSWFLSRVCGFHDIKSATTSIGWIVCVIWVYWPYRYFYFYVEVCCGSKDQVYSFIISNMAQLSILVCICYYFYAMLLILPSLNELNAHPQEQPTFVGRCVMALLLKYLRPLLLYGMNEQKIGILVFVSVINSLFNFLRLLYFLLTANLTVYAWLVAWMFFHVHIMLSLLGLQVINVLMQEMKVEVLCKGSFTSRYVNNLTPDDNRDIAAAEFEASELFDSYLAKSAVYALFMDVPTPESSENESDTDLSTNKVYKAFQVFLQLDFLSEKTRPENDDTPSKGNS